MSLASTVYSTITNSDNWGAMYLKKASLDATVSSVTFVSHLNVDNAGDGDLPPTNHWSMFLEIGASTSVHVDAVPNDPGEPAMIVVETKSSDVTQDASHTVVATAAAGTTIANILSLILTLKRDKYVFAPVGEGCRFWLYTLAQDLAGAEIISQDDANMARNDLQYYWPSPVGTPARYRAFNKGTFLDSA
ncbi:hypothetical protein NEOLEDRAFT_1143115 [Neolentinus lepideus HHB14362 ss-1]|uniref:DUF7770 domain-containing protein n=1 Tax=Neolentinus lepideus HHB14362 ss-1 TaxID=1314782 RepID=A0A165MQM3_9AGAM|nr:hypothetical protein NEOLEDRAFT_1143115 [Neolentinus lepideus HHB14362 ss-1]